LFYSLQCPQGRVARLFLRSAAGNFLCDSLVDMKLQFFIQILLDASVPKKGPQP
jgi:hypothetical protein